MTITEYENLIQIEKKQYFDCLLSTRTFLQTEQTSQEAINQVAILHNKGVTFFNIFERSIDEYGLPNFELNLDTKNRKIEDALSLIEVIINHWKTLEMITTKYSIACPKPQLTAYSSIQRFLKYFRPDMINELRKKFMETKLSTKGFDEKTEFSGWKIGSRNMTIVQIIIGIVFLIAAGFLIFTFDNLNGMQYLFLRILVSLAATIIGTALFEVAIKINWTVRKSLVIKAVGWIAFYILIYYINPPSAPIP